MNNKAGFARDATRFLVMLIPEDSARFMFPKDVRFECNRCALCCGDTETKRRMILLLKSEAEKISQKTLKRLDEFAERTEGQEPYVYLMRKTFDGKCFFLKNSLCAVYETRPLICRFYPFKLDNVGNRNYVFSCTEECPGIGSGPKLRRKFYDTLFAEFVASMG